LIFKFLGNAERSKREKPGIKLYNPAKDSVSTKYTSSNQTATDMSLETKPLSQRKSLIQEKETSTKVFEAINKNFHTSKAGKTFTDTPKNVIPRFATSASRRKPKVSDLIRCEDNSMISNGARINKDSFATTHKQPPSTAPAPLPRNFKRIPTMMEDLTNKEELLRKASLNRARGNSESYQRNH
jgi:hypothetical protein